MPSFYMSGTLTSRHTQFRCLGGESECRSVHGSPEHINIHMMWTLYEPVMLMQNIVHRHLRSLSRRDDLHYPIVVSVSSIQLCPPDICPSCDRKPFLTSLNAPRCGS
jgi:hypothetical protein